MASYQPDKDTWNLDTISLLIKTLLEEQSYEPDTKITETGNAKGYYTIVTVAIATITATGISLLIILACCFRKRLSSVNSIVFGKKKSSIL
ncbi:hypothetical protein QYF36_026504 [Acer negundo]|nr:hypothetical protein QYF36_026504 [Acer negundo]